MLEEFTAHPEARAGRPDGRRAGVRRVLPAQLRDPDRRRRGAGLPVHPALQPVAATGSTPGCRRRFTLLASIAIVGIPLGGVIFLAVLQISQMVTGISHWVAQQRSDRAGPTTTRHRPTELLAKVPFMHINLTPESVRATIAKVGQNVGEIALHFARDSVGSLATIVTSAIIFLYVFLALLVNGDKVLALFRDLNPLGQEVSDIYLAKIGAMVTATVRGQFVIAVVPGRGRRDLDLHRRHPRRLLHVRHLPDRAVVHPAGQRHRHDSARHRNGVVRQRHRRHLRRAVPPHRRHQHRQRAAPVPGAQERAPESGADAAVGVRRPARCSGSGASCWARC